LASVQVGLSPGLELSVTYQLNVLAIAVMYGGPALLQYEKLLIQVIGAAFDAPSSKVRLSLDMFVTL
jgi:proteasome activator subunit 4